MRNILRWVVIGGVFLLPVISLLVSGSFFFSYITFKNFAFRIIVEIICAAWVPLMLYDKNFRPRFSWISVAFAVFVGIIFIADLFGPSPAKSMWSNFERMEGFVTLAHLLMFFIVAGTVLTTEKLWTWFLNVLLVVCSLISCVGFAQLAGIAEISQGGVRIEAGMGNAIYLAVFMFFHVFIALLLLAKAKTTSMRVLYGGLALVFTFLLIASGTRGTTLGLFGGLFVSASYVAIFMRDNSLLRKVALVGVVGVLLIGGAFYMLRNTDFVRESVALGRIASVFSLKEALGTRLTIWGMALEGVKERPLLGWGQSNFDHVFDAHYKPSLYAQEQWFDRVHNIVLDWLIAGGALGFLAYASIWAAVLYALSFRGRKTDASVLTGESFLIVERGLLIGLLIGYGIHNIVVFDNLISYFLFVTILTYVHTRIATDMPRMQAFHFNESVVNQIVVPVMGALLCVSLYYVNIPHIRAATDLIDALTFIDTAARSTDSNQAGSNTLWMRGLSEFKSAIERNSLGSQEIREQIALNAQTIYFDNRATADTKKAYIEFAESELQKQIQERPGTARTHAFFGAFYRTIGEHEKALEQLSIADELSPNKQSILFDIGFTYIDQMEYEKAKEIFKEAFNLAPAYNEARARYIVSAIYAGDTELVAQLSASPYDTLYREHTLILRTYYALKQYDKMLEIIDSNIALNKTDVQWRVSKAAVQHESGNSAAAIETLTQAIKEFPDFQTQGEGYIKQIQAEKP